MRAELAQTERSHPACGGQLAEIVGQTEDTEEITIAYRQYVLRTMQHRKYRCRCNGAVVTAPAPAEPRLIPGGRYSADFATHVAVARCADHLPLDRHMQMMARAGSKVMTSVLWDQIEVLAKVLQVFHEPLATRVLAAPVIGGDESRWRLLDGGTPRWHVWGLASPQAITYRVLEGRSKDAAASLLGGYAGEIRANGYSACAALARGAP